MIMLLSCDRISETTNQTKNLIINKEYYKSGAVEKITTSNLDTPLACCQEFYENGNLKEEYCLIHNRVNGWVKSFYENKVMSSNINYKDNMQNGFSYWYYNNGTLKREDYFGAGVQIFESKEYFPTGALKSYNSKDFTGATTYAIFYDEKGNKTINRGYILSRDYYVKPTDSLVAGKNAVAELYLSSPPKTSTVVKIGEIMGRNQVINMQTIPSEKDHHTLFYKTRLSKSGVHKFLAVGEMTDSVTKGISIDTLHFQIKAK